MMVLCPFADLKKLFSVLDQQRLGIQRNEAWMAISYCLGRMEPKNAKTMKSHLIQMWKPYVPFLQKYYNMCIAEWTSRGFKNNLKLEEYDEKDVVVPPWWGDEDYHSSHRGNLIRKNPAYYHDKLGWTDEPRDGYLWIVDGKRILVDNTAKPKKKANENNDNNNNETKEKDTKRKREAKSKKDESKKVEPTRKKTLKLKKVDVVDLTAEQV